VNPGDFAAFVLVGVAAVSTLTLVAAVARRIVSGRSAGAVQRGAPDAGPPEPLARLAEEVESVRYDVTVLRRELDEALNRLDFSERLLAQARERGLPAVPKER
jgi:hypothetical protein